MTTVSSVARDLGETDKRLWRVLDHYVTRAHAAKDWSAVSRVMIDEEVVSFVDDPRQPVWNVSAISKRHEKIVDAAKRLWSLDGI